jgi:pimeloyl-ACP methyl ester carboxylesterase
MGAKINNVALKNTFRTLLIFILFSLHANSASADVLVLVHGYYSNASTWDISGVSSVLASSGWQRPVHPQQSHRSSDKTFYTIDLPAHAPLIVQTDRLNAFLYELRQQHPDEAFILAGHSAGGVISRLATLRGNTANVTALITIASPHLGTYRASQALDIVDSKPFFCPGPGIDFIKSFFGGDDYDYLKHSRGALIDLLPPESGNLLTWANNEIHPDIHYHSIVRYNPNHPTDNIVPTYSQDMNQIPALAGKARVWPTPAGHSLNPDDGYLLLTILNQLL